MRADGCSIRAISDALEPCPVRRHTVCGIVFRKFLQFFTILRSWEWPAPDYQKSLDFINETGKNCLGASTHEEHDG